MALGTVSVPNTIKCTSFSHSPPIENPPKTSMVLTFSIRATWEYLCSGRLPFWTGFDQTYWPPSLISRMSTSKDSTWAPYPPINAILLGPRDDKEWQLRGVGNSPVVSCRIHVIVLLCPTNACFFSTICSMGTRVFRNADNLSFFICWSRAF